MSIKNRLILIALAAGLTSSLGAATLYSNGLPNQTGGADLNANLAADDFVLAIDRSVNLIRFWTLQADATSYAGTTEWSIRSNASGPAPGGIVQSGSFVSTQLATGNIASGLPEWVHTGAVAFDLSAGAYWLVLHNGPGSSRSHRREFAWAFYQRPVRACLGLGT